MTAWLAIVAAIGVIVGILGGPPYVVAVMVAAFAWPGLWLVVDGLAAWRRQRATRRIVHRRWRAWEFQDWLRRHTGWRS